MDDETERELSIERRINQKHLYSEFPKFIGNYFQTLNFNFDEQLNKTVIEGGMKLFPPFMGESFLLCGSFMEGALNARNLNPTLPNKYYEGELDIMLPLTKILRNRSRDVIVDLEYAKGFTWIKYKPGCFDSPQKLDQFLIKHKDGNVYLNSEAVRDNQSSGNGLKFFPEFHAFAQETIKGPSVNLKFEVSLIENLSTATLTEAIKALQECLGFIENAGEYLERFHCDVSLKLKELEKLVQGNHELISLTNVEELASRFLPVKTERKNLLLEVHWMLLALINETLSAVFIIDKMLLKQDWKEKLGMLRVIYNPTFTPLSNPKELIEGLDSYFRHLLYLMPKEVYQKYNKSHVDGLFHFFQKCLYCQQDEMKKLFQFLGNCKSNLSRTSVWLEVWHGKLRDKLDVIEKFNKVCVSVDNVPAITVEDFPCIANEWVTRDRKWPSLSLVKEIVMSGCHIVPKPYYDKKGNNLLDWRWSFSVAEMILAQFRTRKMDTSYLILKSIFYRYLKPIEHDNETLSSYFVKTVMLWQCEENDETWWSDKSTVKCVSALLNRLKVSFYNKHLSHYFIREINLYDNIADELVLHGQAVLESICADPIICIEEVLESIKETEMNQETIPETDLKENMPLSTAEMHEEIRLFVESLPLLKTHYKFASEKVMPKLFPEILIGSFSEENHLQDSVKFFDDFIKSVESVFSNTFDIPLD